MKTMNDIIQYFDSIQMKAATAGLLAASRRSPDAVPFPPQELCKQYHVSHRLYDRRPAFCLTPEQPQMRLLYLHGGAYYNDFAPSHWRLMDRLAKELNAEIVTPDYPLTPIFGHKDVFSMVTQVYRDCLDNPPCGRFAIAGDSAGGGIALALTQWALSEQLPLPDRLALLSPWLDVTMSDPAIPELNKADPFLEPDSGRLIGQWYAQGEDPHFYQISPLYGPMAGLPPIIVFTGRRDILNADARNLAARMVSVGNCELYEKEGMIHTWMLFPVQEAEAPLARLTEFLRG